MRSSVQVRLLKRVQDKYPPFRSHLYTYIFSVSGTGGNERDEKYASPVSDRPTYGLGKTSLSQFITIHATPFLFLPYKHPLPHNQHFARPNSSCSSGPKPFYHVSYQAVKTSSLLDPSLLLPRVAYSNNTMGRTVDQEVHAAFVEFRAKEDDKVKPLYFLYLGNISTQY